MKKVIKRDNLPTRLPVLFTLVVWLLLDRFDPDGWVHGAVWAVVVLLWVGSVVALVREQDVDIFGGRKP